MTDDQILTTDSDILKMYMDWSLQVSITSEDTRRTALSEVAWPQKLLAPQETDVAGRRYNLENQEFDLQHSCRELANSYV